MIKVSISGAERAKFQAWTRRLTAENQAKARTILIRSTMMFEKYAKMQAPVDTGRLRSSFMVSYSPNKLGSTTLINARYAPYMEFGTGKYVKILPGYEDIAAQFRGKGIREVNIRPRAFFYHNFERVSKAMINDFKRLGFKEA